MGGKVGTEGGREERQGVAGYEQFVRSVSLSWEQGRASPSLYPSLSLYLSIDK
jgi:hypothetical protein